VALLDLREQTLNRARQDHDAEHRRHRAAAPVDPAVLVERTEVVAAATELLAAAGQHNPVVGHRTPPAAIVADLNDQAREAVRRIAVSQQAVQLLHVDGGATDIAAVVRAIAATADTGSGYPVLALPASAAAVDRATGNRYSDLTGDPRTALDNLRSGAWTLPRGGLVVVDGADHLAVEDLRMVAAHAGATGTKLLLVTDHSGPAGPSRELTDALAVAVPWTQHLGTVASGQRATLWERAQNWLNTQPPQHPTTRTGARPMFDPAAESRSTATVYTPPTEDVLRGLGGEPARRAVRRIAAGTMTVTTVTLDGTTAETRSALLRALTATATTDRHPVIAVAATSAAAARAAADPSVREVAAPERAVMALATRGARGWDLPPGTLIVVDDADHCPAHQLNSLIRYAQRDNTKLVLITDHTAPPGPSRALTDALAAAHPWAHHRLGEPDTTHSIAARLRELLTSYDTLTATYRDQHQQELRFWSNWERTQARYRERSRNQHRTRNDGNDLSL